VVHDEHLLFWGGYRDNRARSVLQHLDNQALTPVRELKLVLPSDFSLTGALVVGRDSTLHAFVANAWFTFDLKRALSPDPAPQSGMLNGPEP
jgi:hypothetical protein